MVLMTDINNNSILKAQRGVWILLKVNLAMRLKECYFVKRPQHRVQCF